MGNEVVHWSVVTTDLSGGEPRLILLDATNPVVIGDGSSQNIELMPDEASRKSKKGGKRRRKQHKR